MFLVDDAHLSHSSRGLHEDQSGGRKGKAPGVCDTSSALKRVFGTGEAAAVAVGRERHKRLGYIS